MYILVSVKGRHKYDGGGNLVIGTHSQSSDGSFNKKKNKKKKNETGLSYIVEKSTSERLPANDVNIRTAFNVCSLYRSTSIPPVLARYAGSGLILQQTINFMHYQALLSGIIRIPLLSPDLILQQ